MGYSQAQADEIIHRLSDIMNTFIDAAWGVHPVQLSAQTRGKKDLLPKAGCGKLRTKQQQCNTDGTAASLSEG
ncbi:hypothetical protein [Salipiger sp.]|uniref:hypothetical protein n=1 Tax=Salipiger sp. TaxID=2078585 RepID=UPI003A96FE94